MAGFFAELRRRNVFRVGVAYLVTSWLILQVVDVILPILDLPDWVNRFVFVVLLVGFVVALILAWAYELTPDGVKRENRSSAGSPETHLRSRKLDIAIIALLSTAVIYLFINNYVLEPSSKTASSYERSIAVLPFRSRSSLEEDAYFVDGIHDDLLTQLSRLQWFDKVISRTSTERYRNTGKTIQEIGNELGVATILQGAAQRAGDRVRINVQLIDAETDQQIWANEYDKKLTVENLFETQSEIARAMVTALHGVLSDQDSEALRRQPTTSLEAYQEYVLGQQAIRQRTGESLRRGIDHFEKAVALDPDYELAWVGLAEAHNVLAGYAGLNAEALFEPTQRAIDKALSINPLSGEAYTNLARLRAAQGRLAESEQAYDRALELSPHYPILHVWYPFLLVVQNRLEEAAAAARKAVELDPLSSIAKRQLASMLQLIGRMEESETVLRQALSLEPADAGLHKQMSALLQTQGQIGLALRHEEEALRLNPSWATSASMTCQLRVSLFDFDAAEKCAGDFEARFPHLPQLDRAVVLWARGEFDAAVAAAEAVLEKHPEPWIKEVMMRAYTAVGRLEEANALCTELHPDLLAENDIDVDLFNIHSVIDVATLLYRQDELDRANYLFDEAFEFFSTLHRSRGAPIGLLDVGIHAVRGDDRKAREALREAYDSGWRLTAWQLLTPPMSSLAGDPEWDALVELFVEDLIRQREWYAEQQGEPLVSD